MHVNTYVRCIIVYCIWPKFRRAGAQQRPASPPDTARKAIY